MQTSSSRNNSFLWLLLSVYLLLVLTPLAGFGFGCWQNNSDLSLQQFQRVFSSGRVLGVLARTSGIAAVTAVLSTFIGWWLACCLERFSRRWGWFWLVASAASFLLSPYIFTQGWIGWLGDYGRLWRWLALPQRPFTIYSPSGVVAMLTITYAPLSLILLFISRRLFSRKVLEAGELFRFSGWDWWRLIERKRSGPGLAASFLWIFALSLWAYDVPSMLRQNLYSLELMAAFGSFYDYGRALVLVLPPTLLVVLLGAVSGLAFGGDHINVRQFFGRDLGLACCTKPQIRLAHLAGSIPSKMSFLFFALVAWVVPLLGLVGQINGWAEFLGTLQMFGGDIFNTARNGLLSAFIAAALSFLLAGWTKLTRRALNIRMLVAAQLPLLALPGSVVGIGLVYLLNSVWLSLVVKLNLQLVLVEVVTVLPLTMLLLGALWRGWPAPWSEARLLFGWPVAHHLAKIAWPLFRSSCGVVGILAFAFAIREVPASLLNYPPGGSTLALSIETLLHFDQPGKVATLCLAQLGLLGLVMIPLFFLGKKASA